MKPESTRSLDQKLVNWSEQRLLEKLLTDCRVAGGTLLDAPCGYGRFAPLFLRLGIQGVGIDLDPEEIRLADRRHSPELVPCWAVASIFQLPFRDNAFDCAICIRFLHLSHNDEERLRVLRELARVSERYVIVSFYWPTPLHKLARRVNSTPGRVRTMSLEKFRNLGQASGLKCVSVSSLLPHLHMQTFVVLEKAVV